MNYVIIVHLPCSPSHTSKYLLYVEFDPELVPLFRYFTYKEGPSLWSDPCVHRAIPLDVIS